MPELWAHLDLSVRPSSSPDSRLHVSDAALVQLLGSHRLAGVRTLRWADSKGLSPGGLVAVVKACGGVTALNISGCSSVDRLGPVLQVLQVRPLLCALIFVHVLMRQSMRNVL